VFASVSDWMNIVCISGITVCIKTPCVQCDNVRDGSIDRFPPVSYHIAQRIWCLMALTQNGDAYISICKCILDCFVITAINLTTSSKMSHWIVNRKRELNRNVLNTIIYDMMFCVLFFYRLNQISVHISIDSVIGVGVVRLILFMATIFC